MIERAGFWRRAVAALVDMAAAQVVLQGLVVLLFAATSGGVVTSYGVARTCQTAAEVPAGAAIPPGLAPTDGKLCTTRFLGAPTDVVYEAELQRPDGGIEAPYETPTSPDGIATRRVMNLDDLFFPLFILIRWSCDRFGRGSIGRRLVGIMPTAEGGLPPRRSLDRRYAGFAWPYAPGVLMVGALSAIVFATGGAPPLVLALSWATGTVLVSASQLAAILAILGRRDTFYDTGAGTAVLRRSAVQPPADDVSRARLGLAPGLRETGSAAPSSPPRVPWISLSLATVMVVVFVAEVLFPAGPTAQRDIGAGTLVAYGAMDRDLVFGSHQIYRLLTAVFVHGSATHLTLNVLALLVSGWLLESLVGPLWFVAAFMLGGLGASAASVAINAADQVAAGASGATLALSAAVLVVSARVSPGPRRDWMWAWPVAAAFPALVPTLPLPGAVAIAVDRADHVGGVLTGLLVGGLIVARWPKDRPRPSHGTLAGAVTAATVVALLASILLTGVRAPRGRPVLVPPEALPQTAEEWLARSPDLSRRYPDDPRALLFASQAEVLAGDGSGALRDLDRAIAASRRLSPLALPAFAFHSRSAVAGRFFESGDLDRAIALYGIALAEPEQGEAAAQASALRQRGVAEFYRARPDEAAADLDRAVRLAPDAYAALWHHIIRARTGRAEAPQALAAALAAEDWPTPLLRFYLGEIDAAALARAVDTGEPGLFATRRCEADLYLGEWQVIRRDDVAARLLLAGARAECPHDFIEYRAASEELAGAAGFPKE